MKKSFCEECGFVPEWHGQLDVDHVDGNHHNNDEFNLRTLCANCHRLKTHQSSDNLNPGRIGTSNPEIALTGSSTKDGVMLVKTVERRCACGNKSRPNGITCWSCRTYKHRRHPKGDKCLLCGFKPEWAGQLDMDHIDGNRHNNVATNLQTLCANCHRLKTHQKRDYAKQVKVESINS
jgi:5-methylcytosine-specific restriction endonuclease McrA